MDSNQLTRCEAEVMDIVWSSEPVTIGDVMDSIQRELAYTTVMTTFKILEEKGFLERGAKRGRAFLYHSVVSREAVCQSMANTLKERLFGGSIKSLVLSLVGDGSVSDADLDELRSAIASLESES